MTMNGIFKAVVQTAVLALAFAASTPTVHAQETVEYIHTDALGSPIAVTDANGVVIERTVYEPYGAVVGGQVKDGPGYTGHVSDSATGLSYMKQRYMDPELGTFLSIDPVGTSPVDGLNFGRYRYASSNPYTNRDPDGRCDGPSTCAIDRDIYPLNSGKMPMDEFRSRSEARGAGALIGAGLVVAGRLAIALTPVAAKFSTKLGGPPKINEAQQKNLARFEKKFSRENRKVEVKMDRDGNATFKNEVPGRVPGSKAVYEKTVDASGKTTAAGNTTYDPKGEIVHIKDKL